MAIRTVSIPVSEIEGLLSGGSYIFQYRVKSKDGSRTSDWSAPIKLSYPTGPSGAKSSILELYAGGVRPSLLDNHASSGTAYTVPSSPVTISVTKSEQDESVYVCSWTVPEYMTINKTYDIYMSWKDSSNWRDWTFYGTTTANNFTFERIDADVQFVQIAIFVSSFPKYTYFTNKAEETFLAMTPAESVWQGANGTMGAVTTVGAQGLYTAQITGLTVDFPAGSKYVGRRIFGTSNGGSLGNGVIRIASRQNATTINITSTATMTAGTLNNLRF
jgi:hypothetical protein